MRARPALVAAVVLVALAAAGCQGASKPTAAQGPVTLRFATAAGFDVGGQKQPLQDFVDRIHSLSGGKIFVSVAQDVGEGSATAEPSLIKAIEKGTYDGGWNSVRGFPAADIHAFEAAEAPFVIESYRVEEQFVSSPLAGLMLARLKGTGLIGLGLIAGPLRRPFAVAHPLLQPSDWRGVAFRIEDTPEQKATVAAAGRAGELADVAAYGPDRTCV